LGKIFSQANKPRVPDAVDGIQINFCKNPICSNYGVPASVKKQPRGPGASLRGRDNYKVQASRTQWPFLKSLYCNVNILLPKITWLFRKKFPASLII
jgi:hypothetical protein